MLEHPAVRALLLSFAAGLSTLLGALVVFFTKTKSQKLLAISLGFAAGAMLYVVVEELIPEMSQGKHSNLGTGPWGAAGNAGRGSVAGRGRIAGHGAGSLCAP